MLLASNQRRICKYEKWACAVSELPGELGVNPSVFSTPLNIMSNCVLRVSYTYDLHHNFGRALTVEKFKPPANISQFKQCACGSTFLNC